MKLGAMTSLEKRLAQNSAAWGQRMAAVPVVLRWLCEKLVCALLHGAWLQVCKRQGAAYDRAFARFTALVDAAPCWPCRVEFSHRLHRDADGARHAGLCILS